MNEQASRRLRVVRRSFLITAIAVVTGILAIWWMSRPPADQRFVGVWSGNARPADIWVFDRNGDGTAPNNGRFRWQVAEGRMEIYWQRPSTGWQDYLSSVVSRLTGTDHPQTMEIIETGTDSLRLKNKDGFIWTLTRSH